MRIALITLALALLGACSPPPSAPPGDPGDVVSRDLGPAIRPIRDGLWRLSAVLDESGETPVLPGMLNPDPGAGALTRPHVLDLHVIRWDTESGSYASGLANLRFHAFAGETLLVEIRVNPLDLSDEGSSFLLARVGPTRDRVRLLIVPCSDIPQDFREQHGFTQSECRTADAAVLREALGRADIAAAEGLVFERVADLP